MRKSVHLVGLSLTYMYQDAWFRECKGKTVIQVIDTVPEIQEQTKAGRKAGSCSSLLHRFVALLQV